MTMGSAFDRGFNAMIVSIGRAVNRWRHRPKQTQWEPDEQWAAQFLPRG